MKAIILVFIIAVGIVSTVTLVVVRTVVPDVIQLGKGVQIEQLEEGTRNWVVDINDSSWGKFMQLNRDVARIVVFKT